MTPRGAHGGATRAPRPVGPMRLVTGWRAQRTGRCAGPTLAVESGIVPRSKGHFATVARVGIEFPDDTSWSAHETLGTFRVLASKPQDVVLHAGLAPAVAVKRCRVIMPVMHGVDALATVSSGSDRRERRRRNAPTHADGRRVDELECGERAAVVAELATALYERPELARLAAPPSAITDPSDDHREL
jgi:hypothetical protein